jgi:hypothetical protein
MAFSHPRHHLLAPSSTLSLLLLLLFSISAFSPTPAARAQTALPTIYNGSSKYAYYGCYNETVDIPGSTDSRAIGDGTNEVLPGTMTVPDCLGFCSSNGTTYKYAGLEFSRLVGVYACCGGTAITAEGRDRSVMTQGDTVRTRWLMLLQGMLVR